MSSQIFINSANLHFSTSQLNCTTLDDRFYESSVGQMEIFPARQFETEATFGFPTQGPV